MINFIIEIVATITDVLLLIWFIPHFNNVSVWKCPKTLIWPGILLIFQLLADNFLKGEGTSLFNILGVFICALGFSLFLGNQRIEWRIFSAILYTIIPMLANCMIYAIFSLLIVDSNLILPGGNPYARVIFIMVTKTVHVMFYQGVLLIFKKNKNLDTKNGILSFIFTFSTAICLSALMRISMLKNDKIIQKCILVLSVLLIVLNIILYIMIKQIQRLLQSKFSLALMEERARFEKSKMEEVNIAWNNIRKIKHDMKNHFTVMQGELESGNVDDCKKYLAELTESVGNIGDLVQSGNNIIDYLINTKLAAIKDIQIVISGEIDDYSDINDLDLACILGNVIDNAIEAEEKEKIGKYIELLFFRENNQRIIICKNKISESVLKVNKQLKSTKASSELHGIGHQIVESKVEKYNGLIDYFEENDMFGVQILLPIKNK